MNFTQEDINAGIVRDRVKIGSSLADVDPMNIDRSVTFSSVGGLGKHIQALKEMIVFPLLYPEVFEKFHIDPPRGCLFYGPPGIFVITHTRAHRSRENIKRQHYVILIVFW